MKTQQPSRVPSPFRILRKVCGLLLVVAAIGGVVQAGDPVGVPEIDPGSLGGALTLLVGGLLMIKDRCLRR